MGKSAMPSAPTPKQLVFNIETGDFELVDNNSVVEGDAVTMMTKEGFACV